MSVLACAFGVREPALSAELAAFLREAKPWALILFREACQSPQQVRTLTASLREACGHDAIVWIDQEGGRVARLKAPRWPVWPAAMGYADLYARDALLGLEAAGLGHRLIAHELRAIGVNGSFAPVLDVPVDGSDPIVGDRAFGREPETVTALARAALGGLTAGGVVGCVKHIPGHGRARVDSHLALPQVTEGLNELGQDFAPFRAFRDAPCAMTAHIVYAAIDPASPATQSAKVISFIRNDIGFEGLLVSDDLDMRALSGGLDEKAHKAFAAGCDLVLQCNGKVADMATVAANAKPLEGEALRRAEVAAKVAASDPAPFDAAAGWWRLRGLMGEGVGLRTDS
jgi:beta-N-acetylhexosaminidase